MVLEDKGQRTREFERSAPRDPAEASEFLSWCRIVIHDFRF